MDNGVDSLLESTVNKIKSVIDVDTIIGSKIILGDITIIPVSRISYGFGVGGSDFGPKKSENSEKVKPNFGGGGGSGVSIVPIGFLVTGEPTGVRFLQVETFNGPFDRAISMAPDIFSKIKSFFSKDKNEKNKKNKEENENIENKVPE